MNNTEDGHSMEERDTAETKIGLESVHREKESGIFESKVKPESNPRRKLTDNILVLYILTIFLITLGQFLGIPLEFIPFMTNTDIVVTATLYLEFIGVWIVLFLYMRFTKKNRPLLKAAGRQAKGNNWKMFLLGIVMGFGLNGICILAAWLHKDISFYFGTFQPLYILCLFVAVFIQSSAEEMICRGFLYQRLRMSYRSPAVAVIGNSLLFAFLHLFNNGVTVLAIVNIFVVGVLFSLIIYYMNSLWCAMALHTAWNFTQNILFGLPNSGMISPYSLFRLDTATVQDSFAYNVGFGVEGTVFADVVIILACIAIWLWGQKNMVKGRKNGNIKDII